MDKLTTLRLGGFLVGKGDCCWPPDLGPQPGPPMDRGLRGALGERKEFISEAEFPFAYTYCEV